IGTFLNNAGAVFNMTGVTGNNTFYQAITNHGTINFSGTGTLTPNAGTSITNSGSINLNAGQWDWNFPTTHTGVINIASGATLNLTTGTCTLNAGSALSGTGIFRLGGATLAQNITWTNSSLAIVMAGGTWSTSSGNVFTIDVGGTFNWSGGALGGPGTYAVDLGATLNMITGGKTLNSTLTNNGTIAWSGGQLVGTGNIQNASGGTLNITFSGITNPLAVTVVNNGTINYTHSGNFNTWFPFTNNGTLNVNSGQWHFNNSAVSSDGVLNIATGAVVQVNVATTLGASASITGGGILRISNTLTQNFPWTVSIYAVELIGGTWNGSGAITFPATGIFNWTAGTLSGTGGYSVDTGASISIYTTNTKTVGGTLTNNGTINWSGG
ncbi:MAG TPA: hypothetical protein PKY96_11815, partial [Flavobacteriales bacterium]|nr:hypothetical protein [Flavobacteriales bacterium]